MNAFLGGGLGEPSLDRHGWAEGGVLVVARLVHVDLRVIATIEEAKRFDYK